MVPGSWYFRGTWQGDASPPRGRKVIVKPTYESMCIGVDHDSVQIVDSGFGQFMHERFERLAQPLVVQEFVTGDEVGIPVLRLERPYALPLVACRRRDGSQFGELPKTFDDDSVTLDTSDVLFEASDDVYRLIQSVGAAAFDALEMTGVGRIDVRLDIDGRPWVFDTNEAPPPLADTAFAVSMNALGHDLRGMLKIWLGSCLYEYGVISGIEPEGQIGQQEHATQF